VGGVKCWGRNNAGQLGDGTTTNSSTPVNVVGLSSGVVAIAAGTEHTCALISGGAVRCWGRNWAGQLGDGTFNDSLTPVTVSGLSSGAAVLAAGITHTCASTGTGVKCWGRNWENQLGDGTQTNSSVPVDVASLSDTILAISAGNDFTCALNNQSIVKCWGRNSEGQLGDGTQTDRLSPVVTQGLTGGAVAMASKWQDTCAVLTSGAVKCWGMNDAGQVGNNTASRLLEPGNAVVFPSSAISLSVGFNNSCLVANDTKAYCWGLNNWWQIGDGTRTDRTDPRQVDDLSGVLAVSNGAEHSCALLSTGGAKCWGFGWAGQLGNGTWDMQLTPVDVTGLTSGVLRISSGWFHICAVTNTGSLKCWGRNSEGQLGDGTTNWSSTPVDVTGLSNGVLDVASGYFHTCAVLTGGNVKCWGNNSAGQLGDGTTSSSLVPVNVLSVTNAIAISLGVDHTCALTSVGGVKCWGSNSDGELGDGTWTNQSSPVDVNGLASGVAKIAVGAYHSCALLNNGEARCWGWNASGQVGNNTTNSIGIPVNVLGLSGGQMIDAGGDHTCSLLNNGTIKCWGSNGYGQLGLGDTPWKLIPVGVLLDSVKLPLIMR
jgi:alpha-tubulin suppressor-like RCC1 family protein